MTPDLLDSGKYAWVALGAIWLRNEGLKGGWDPLKKAINVDI